MTTQRLVSIALLLAFASLGRPAVADETTFCNTYITSLPYTIATQGHYCFDRNLSTSITSGAAITIAADYVLLDLNHFKLGGGGAGPATTAIGIFANDRSNLTIRNGNIRGFAFGIFVNGSTLGAALSAQKIIVENNVLDSNTVSGITVFATGFRIRGNQIFNTGGSTSTTVDNCYANPPYVTGISTIGGPPDASCNSSAGFGQIDQNLVVGTFPAAVASSTRAFSILASYGAAVTSNVVMAQSGSDAAILGAICRDNTARDIEAVTAYNCYQMVGINSDL